MSKFRNHLNEKIKNKEFREAYNYQKKLTNLAFKIKKERKKKDYTQEDLANFAGITQQQLSKIENANSANIITYLKVIEALQLEIKLSRLKSA